jgi:hypothetical protein
MSSFITGRLHFVLGCFCRYFASNFSPSAVIRSLYLAFAVVAFAGSSGAAYANIVQNPGFEADAALLGPSGPCNGTIPSAGAGCAAVTDWSVTGDAGEDTANPHSGSVDAFLGTGTLSQTLTTLVGATYSISFYLAADPNTLNSAANFFLGIGGNNATVDTTFGADDLGTLDAVNDYFLSGTSADEYLQWIFADTAAGASTALTFTGFNPDGTWYIDDVDVECTANCGVTPVPEPPAMMLLLTALATALGISSFRKRGADGRN